MCTHTCIMERGIYTAVSFLCESLGLSFLGDRDPVLDLRLLVSDLRFPGRAKQASFPSREDMLDTAALCSVFISSRKCS